MDSLTPYQRAQLLHIRMTGAPRFTTSAGTKVPRPTWRKMITALLDAGAIDGRMHITAAGRGWLDANRGNIDMGVL